MRKAITSILLTEPDKESPQPPRCPTCYSEVRHERQRVKLVPNNQNFITKPCTALCGDPWHSDSWHSVAAEESPQPAQPSFPVGRCKHCGKDVPDSPQDGKTIIFCSYECYCLD